MVNSLHYIIIFIIIIIIIITQVEKQNNYLFIHRQSLSMYSVSKL